MSRDRAIAQILALLAHAEADTEEGRTAARIAARLRARFHVSDEGLEEARVERGEAARTVVDLDGWAVPWLVVLAATVAETFDVKAQVGAGPEGPVVALVGPGAGRAARRAREIRARVEARVARMGGVDAISRLTARAAAYYASTAGGNGFGWGGFNFNGPTTFPAQTLADACGSSAVDVFRVVVLRHLLEPDLRAALERRRKQQEERNRAAWEAMRKAWAGEPTAEAPPSDSAPSGAAEPPPSGPLPSEPPPPPTEAELRVRQLAEEIQLLLRRAGQVAESRPTWAAEDEPVVPGALVCVGGAA